MTNHAELFHRASDAVTAALGAVPDEVDIPKVLCTSKTLAGRIDHTLLKADATLSAIETLCDEAKERSPAWFASTPAGCRPPPSGWPDPA